jgi:hypothetical protein
MRKMSKNDKNNNSGKNGGSKATASGKGGIKELKGFYYVHGTRTRPKDTPKPQNESLNMLAQHVVKRCGN